MIGDKPFFGILLMLGFCVLAPMGDSIGKYLSDKVPLFQLLTWRFVIQALLLLPLVVLARQRMLVSPRITALAALRTALHILGIGTMFLSLRYLPLADAIAIAFVMPFIMLLLGRLVLKETVGLHRLGACAVGFAGTLLVIQPNFATVGAPALLPLGVAVFFALFILVTRQIAKEIDPVALQALSGSMAGLVMVPLAFLALGSDTAFAFEPISRGEIGFLLLLGIVGTTAHLAMSWSLRFAPSATLAPMQYLEIPFATFMGWLVFDDLPNTLATIGITITVFSGLYIIRREHLAMRPALQPRPQVTRGAG